MSELRTAHTSQKPPLWRNVKALGWALQLTVLAIVLLIVGWLVNNVRTNSSDQGIPVNFDYLDQPADFPITASNFRQTQPVKDALIVGTLNTLRVAVAGIILATILGVLVGIGRLSKNWLLRTVSTTFVETLRNVPLLGVVAFAYLGFVLSGLPRPQDTWKLGDLVLLNVRGVAVPWISGRGWLFLLVLLAAAVVAWAVARWRKSVAERTGTPARDLLWAIPTFGLVAFWGSVFAGIGTSVPELDGRRFAGGIVLQPEYFALLVALVLYTASHIAEIVRGSIQAVAKGQEEAASALALSPSQRMRLIILPQAMRIALPPLGNQYLNLLKNSSLGFVISYFELTKVAATTIGTRSPAIPTYMTLMGIYLVMSLFLSGLVNLVNRRLTLVER